jgi:hypothetical protein
MREEHADVCDLTRRWSARSEELGNEAKAALEQPPEGEVGLTGLLRCGGSETASNSDVDRFPATR